jgi:PAS domain-containing protein
VTDGSEHCNDDAVSTTLGTPGTAKPLPLILARELAANLATPMFLLDARGMLVFYNDAAAVLIGRQFSELGEIPAAEFHSVLETSLPDGTALRRQETPAGIAFYSRRPAHKRVIAKSYDGVRRDIEATAYPLFGATGEMHGVVSVFWELGGPEPAA